MVVVSKLFAASMAMTDVLAMKESFAEQGAIDETLFNSLWLLR